MVKVIGVKVIVIGGSDEKVVVCLLLGVDVVINYKMEDIEVWV